MSLSKDLQDIVEIINKINPEILHLGAAPEFLALKDVQNLKKQFPNLRIMRSIPVNDEKSVELAKQYSGVVDYLLLDTQEKSGVSVGATGETHDWSISKKKSLNPWASLLFWPVGSVPIMWLKLSNLLNHLA